jgi:hypothetical protein
LPNLDPKLEEDWQELKVAREHYDKLLKEFQDKQKVWDALNSQDE